MDDSGVDELTDGGEGNTTYIAWDGAERPWPPPENWYRAVDGRWWHPAYGPDEPPDPSPVQDAAPSSADRTTSGSSTPATRSEPPLIRQAETGPEPHDDLEPHADRTVDGEVDDRDVGVGRRSEPKPWAAGAAIAIAILGIAAAAQIALGGSTDDPVASGGEPAGAVASDDIDGGGAGSIRSSDTDPEVAGAVTGFRRAMSEHGLSTEELTDDQISAFASTFCLHAAEAEDRAAFDELRLIAVESSRSNLTSTQLDLTIDTAITVFCPAESDRLGISSDQSGS